MKRVSLIFLSFLIFGSCNSGVDTQALRDEVLDIHDEVMPKIGEVMSLRKKVMTKSQELALTDNYDQNEVASLDSLANALEVANKGMMRWMNDWSQNSSSYLDQDANPAQGVTDEALIEFLDEEKVRITNVKTDINGAIAEAKKVLNN